MEKIQKVFLSTFDRFSFSNIFSQEQNFVDSFLLKYSGNSVLLFCCKRVSVNQFHTICLLKL